ncbi:MAG: aryl-alcohol dehydrogenase-like predicted oxidoreductase [Saprospiraceae bacterium]|jgi:aryl-alcohol dehydrogenase-like predicted oxidoreductase
MENETIIGLGTAAIGRPSYINIKDNQEEVSLEVFKQTGPKVLTKAYELGVRYFDTAPGYGMAEELLTNWISEFNNKIQDISVGTKWGYTYVANFDKNATVHEIKDHSIEKLTEQWHTSKGFSHHLSYYQIHSAGFDTNVLFDEKVLAKLHEIKKQTGIKIGISTTGAEQVKTIEKALEIKEENEFLFDSFQVTYNMLDQSLRTILGKLKALKKTVIVKEALANGRLFSNDNYPEYAPVYNALNLLANKYQVGVDAVALRFVMDSIQPTIVLSGASSCEQIEQNLKAMTFKLTSEEVQMLTAFKVSPEHYWLERKKLAWN